MNHKFRPTGTNPVELGPVEKTRQPVAGRPIDEYLQDLYGPGETPRLLIEAEPMPERTEPRFPLAMWAWSAATLALAILAIILILG